MECLSVLSWYMNLVSSRFEIPRFDIFMFTISSLIKTSSISYHCHGGLPATTILLRLPFDFSPHVKVFAWDKSFSFALQSFWQKPLVLVFVWFSSCCCWVNFFDRTTSNEGWITDYKSQISVLVFCRKIMRVELSSR